MRFTWTLSSILGGARLRRMLLFKRALLRQGLIVPLKAKTALADAKAAIEAGAKVLEVYLRSDGEETSEADIKAALDAIAELRKRYPDAFIGAGSADQPELAALAIMAGADFIVSQGYVRETVAICAYHQVPCVLGASDCAEISQYVQAMNELYRFYVSDDELAELDMSRVEAEMHLVKFFVAKDRVAEFDGMAATYNGKGIRFVIAGGVGIKSPTYDTVPADKHSDQSVASWCSRKLVGAVTSSSMMSGDVKVDVETALKQVQYGRSHPPAIAT